MFRVSLFMYQCHNEHNSKKFKLGLLENWKRNSVVNMLSLLVTEKSYPSQQGRPVPRLSKNVLEGILSKLNLYLI